MADGLDGPWRRKYWREFGRRQRESKAAAVQVLASEGGREVRDPQVYGTAKDVKGAGVPAFRALIPERGCSLQAPEQVGMPPVDAPVL